MTTHASEVIAVPAQIFLMNEAVLKQIAVLFNRIAFPGLSAFLALPAAPALSNNFDSLKLLAETGILFEPQIQPTADQGFKGRMMHDMDELYRPVGVKAEDLLASRNDEQKALEVKNKVRGFDTAFKSEATDPLSVLSAIQRMIANLTRIVALELRNLHHMDAHAILSNDLSALEVEGENPSQHDALRIAVAALPLPDHDVSWQQIIEYRNDPNSLNRFRDLRNWIADFNSGQFAFPELEQRLGSVLKRFRKQMELHRLKTVNTSFEAIVTTNSDALRNIFSHQGNTIIGTSCSVEHRKLVLLENESPSKGSEVAYALEAGFPFGEES